MEKFAFIFLLSFSFSFFAEAAQDTEASKNAPDYRLHDIWVLTHIDNVAFDSDLFKNNQSGMPQFEFFVDDKTLRGNTGCNQFSTSFLIIELGKLEIDNAITTRMMCPQMEVETLLQQDFFGKVLDYEIADLQLTLINNNGKSIRFKKVD